MAKIIGRILYINIKLNFKIRVLLNEAYLPHLDKKLNISNLKPECPY
jgi:hypothetical protein